MRGPHRLRAVMCSPQSLHPRARELLIPASHLVVRSPGNLDGADIVYRRRINNGARCNQFRLSLESFGRWSEV